MYTFHSCGSSTPSNSYVYDITPCALGLATISSDDYLRILDPSRLEGPPIVVHQTSGDVVCLRRVRGDDAEILCTAGRDGTVSIWDLRSRGRVGGSQSNQNAPILSLAVSAPYSLAAGTELMNHEATIAMWDMRELQKPVRRYIESHSDDITELNFHPTHATLLLSGSTDGLVNIFDTTQPDEDEALQQTLNHGHSVHRANFLSNDEMFALAHDEHFALYELITESAADTQERTPGMCGDVREVLAADYVASVLTRPDGGAVMGVGTHGEGTFDLVHLKKDDQKDQWMFELEAKVRLAGAHGADIVRSFCFLDYQQTVYTAGEDGLVKGWRARE